MGELKRIAAPVSTRLEMTEISDRVLRWARPCCSRTRSTTAARRRCRCWPPVRHAGARGARHGADDVSALRDIGELLASLRDPEAPKGLRDALAKVSMLKSALWDMSPKNVKSPACQEVVWEGKDVDLTCLADPDLAWRWRRS